MALLREKKNQIVSEVSSAMTNSKMTVVVEYKGTPVKALQQLRRESKASGTTLKIVKNRLAIKALDSNPVFKDIDTKFLNGMLLYVFNDQDEVAGAQAIANFAKNQPTLKIVGAITNQGILIGEEDANIIATLATKAELRAILVGTLAAPLTGFVGILSGNVRSLLNVLTARADSINV